jgi:hypothetical protein
MVEWVGYVTQVGIRIERFDAESTLEAATWESETQITDL